MPTGSESIPAGSSFKRKHHGSKNAACFIPSWWFWFAIACWKAVIKSLCWGGSWGTGIVGWMIVCNSLMISVLGFVFAAINLFCTSCAIRACFACFCRMLFAFACFCLFFDCFCLLWSDSTNLHIWCALVCLFWLYILAFMCACLYHVRRQV